MLTPAIDSTTLTVPPTSYFREPQRKDLIVLGCTKTPTADWALSLWKKPGRLCAAPYIVDLDGTIYQTFDPRAWSLHLNMPAALNPTARNDRRSIAVRLVNPGCLKPRPDGRLAWWYENYTCPWCSLADTSAYIQRSFRGYHYFATYTDQQMKALRTLLPWLCREHGIPFQLPPPDERLSADLRRWTRFRGVLAHHHFRPEHVDVGPAFDWDQIAQTGASN